MEPAFAASLATSPGRASGRPCADPGAPRLMHVHILGIAGTFMGGIAALAKAAGHRVSGADLNMYPPMSTQLAGLGVQLIEGWDPGQLEPAPDIVVVGNVLSRGNPVVEAVLERGIPYTSGPQWLAEHVLAGRWVLGVAGTHGKTTTASVLAFLLDRAGRAPGFLIGGIASDFGVSARAGLAPFFVVEADEYDTAFFDKRAKFVHYHPRTAILTNLEHDHADIYSDVASIRRQFHHLVRTVPGNGRLIVNGDDEQLAQTLAMGCWTPVERFGHALADGVRLRALNADWTSFAIEADGATVEVADSPLLGRHNAENIVAAMLAARHAGVALADSAVALPHFQGVKRRLEVRGIVRGVTVYDDFAHHPTAIAATLGALRARLGDARLLAVLEPRSNTMKLGVHKDALGHSLAAADRAYVFAPPGLGWDVRSSIAPCGDRAEVWGDLDELCSAIVRAACTGDHIVVMSNGGFGGLHERLLKSLAATGS
jgi:UDP-N-acetylmuramate: L-alanyl-gamma-D-glutamyl-meso-diaminopimelate ligase